jgi:hypothetical protein
MAYESLGSDQERDLFEASEKGEDAKLRLFRKRYEDRCNHFKDSIREKVEALSFVAGQQWREADLRVLKEQKRAAFTMNVVFQKIQTLVGMNEDGKRSPRIAPLDGKDVGTAEVVDALLQRVLEDAGADEVDSQVYEAGVVTGEGYAQLTATRDPKRPSWISIHIDPLDPTEILPDPTATRRSRADARDWFQHRWVSREEFLREYPQHRAALDSMMEGESSYYAGSAQVPAGGAGGAWGGRRGDYDDGGLYVSREKREVKIIRCEYLQPVKRPWVETPDGQVKQIDDELAVMIEQGAGVPAFQGVSVLRVWDHEVRVIEFMGSKVLFEDVLPEPYEGFSIEPFPCYIDGKTGCSFGPLRNLIDPQRDVNKAHSVSLDHMMAQSKPGWIAEASAIDDKETFEEDNAKGGSVAIVNDGGLTGGKVQPRQVPVYSDAAARRLQVAVEMVDRISGIFMDAESPARAVEAAATVALREKKAIRSLQGVLRNFHRYQKGIARRVVETIVAAMPDDQILALLGSSERYQIAPGGVIVDTERKEQIQIRDLRNLRYDIELQPSEASEMQRLSQLNVLLQVLAIAPMTPVDPEVLLELVAGSRSMSERLKGYARQVREGTAKQAAEEQKAQRALMAGEVALKGARFELDQRKAMEESADRKRQQKIDRVESATDAWLAFLALWEKADEAEKLRLQTMFGGDPRSGEAVQQ